jgi:hypothetical protein
MYTRSLKIIVSAVLLMFMSSACKQVVTNEKPGSHARISELLVVMDKVLWQGELGDTVRNFFGDFYPYLNQPEARFSIIYRTPGEFNETYSIYRNILYFVMEPELDGGKVMKEIDYWAKPQTVIQLNGNNGETLLGLFLKNQDAILQAYEESEVRRLKGVMNSISKPGNAQQVTDSLDLKIAVPEGYYLAKKGGNFIWARKVIKSQTQESAFWITTFAYTDTSQFNPAKVLAMRDTVAKANIPVQDEVSYMGTEYRFGYQNRVIEINGNYTLETRGFWRTYGNHSMGGPFINFLVHDEKRQRLIMIDCYVFKPNEDKRDLVRQLEGIAHTLIL